MLLAALSLTAAACSTDGRASPSPTGSEQPASEQPTPTETPSDQLTPERRSFTVAATGDVLVHPGVWMRAQRDGAAEGTSYDFLPMFRQIRPHIEDADLAICHMEVPFGPDGAAPKGFPLFSAPPQVADALGRLGYDSCSTASNHGIDRGEDGVRRTLDAFDEAGVHHAGTARSQQEHDTPNILDANGVKVAHLSYTYGHNNARPADKPWLINVLADDRIIPDAEAARAAGAEVVIVSIHWGTEFVQSPTSAQTELATELMDSPAVDLVLGHHAHVVQPIQQFGDRFVVYGMGNIVSAISHDYAQGASREGILPEFTFTEGEDGRFTVTEIIVNPTYVDPLGGLHITDVAAALADPEPGEDVARLRRAQQRTAAVINSLGADAEVVSVR